MLDIICIGDTMHDTFLMIDEAKVVCTIDTNACLICLNYADKIPVKELHETTAGNAANAAVGFSRLGFTVALVSMLGDDEAGKRAKRDLTDEDIDLKYTGVEKETATNASTVLNYAGERTILVYHHPHTYTLPKLEPAKIVYLTSMGPGSERLYQHIFQFVDRHNAKLIFNPGTFQLRLGPSKTREILMRTDILILNLDEASIWARLEKNKGAFTIAQKLKTLGPKIIVITDGPHGSFALSNEGFWKLGIFDVPRYESTGAGDSFATAFTAALLKDQSVPEALRWGAINSASVIQYIGPQKGLLMKDQLLEQLRKHQSFQPKRSH